MEIRPQRRPSARKPVGAEFIYRVINAAMDAAEEQQRACARRRRLKLLIGNALGKFLPTQKYLTRRSRLYRKCKSPLAREPSSAHAEAMQLSWERWRGEEGEK